MGIKPTAILIGSTPSLWGLGYQKVEIAFQSDGLGNGGNSAGLLDFMMDQRDTAQLFLIDRHAGFQKAAEIQQITSLRSILKTMMVTPTLRDWPTALGALSSARDLLPHA